MLDRQRRTPTKGRIQNTPEKTGGEREEEGSLRPPDWCATNQRTRPGLWVRSARLQAAREIAPGGESAQHGACVRVCWL